MIHVDRNASPDAIRPKYIEELCKSGHTPEEAGQVFDTAWLACAEAQAKLADIVNRLPERNMMQLNAVGLAAYFTQEAMQSLIAHAFMVASLGPLAKFVMPEPPGSTTPKGGI